MQLTDSDFFKMRDFMYQNFGINLSQKRTLIEGRLSNVLKQRGFNNFTEYVDHVLSSKSDEEISLLVSKLTTNFTYFLREDQHFDFMTQTAFPEILPNIKNKSLAIWSAGCSSGEEPYTIAMVIDNYFKGNKKGMDTRVLATDISDNVLRKAKNGVYNADRMTRLPDTWIKKYFTKIDEETYQVSSAIKQEVIFRKFNLMEPVFHFKRKFDIIFCRNVMIYFDNAVRLALVKKYAENLRPGGYLFIGLSENLVHSNDIPLQYVRPSIYRKVER